MELVGKLNRHLANWFVMYTKLHSYHWYVNGSSFFVLHKRFAKLNRYSHEVIDEVAEQILVMKNTPIATIAEALKLATVAEALDSATLAEETNVKNSEEMVKQIIIDFRILIIELTEIIELAEIQKYQGIADMALGIQSKLETEIWKLSSCLTGE
ncbi:starvation-inducible DNA-binding protein [Granulicatella balaenopterae]|uniref:Starvation-inducible DNA-binding protein n=1 Tax=Granulicatella balaenopterae TaxID=137733 RepID=A0A1H9LIR5_9LACT|nr:ferritin-like domain-containing protein [Granulicatella balaenopterae]SER11015.1 starvation-inducible DNA-binding protein [Granulicatella balaenopterae]